jgi:hypothetical protein
MNLRYLYWITMIEIILVIKFNKFIILSIIDDGRIIYIAVAITLPMI